MRLIDCLDHGLSFGAGKPCLIDADGTTSYADVVEHTWRIAAQMHARGARPGVRAAVLASNSAAAFACIMGILRLDGVWIPLNSQHSVADHDHFLNTTECEWLFYEAEAEERARHLASVVPTIRELVSLDTVAEWKTRASSDRCAVAADIAGHITSVDDPCILFGSGGTTGRPKAVIWSQRMMETLMANYLIGLRTDGPLVHLACAPISHAAGVISFPLIAMGGATVILPRAEPSAILDAIETYGVTTLFLPPTVIYGLLAHPRVRDVNYSSLRNFVYAAAPMSVEKLKQAIEIFGPVMTQTFGQAEAPMVCTLLTPSDHMAALESGDDRRLLSCGKPCPFNEMAILDDDGKELGVGERGEIAVRSGLVTPGYYRNPEATANAFKNGWLCTQDIGYRDEDGFYYIVDRKRDMIISGGFNIYPSEVEQVLWSAEAVQDCAVIGVPDERWGEAVKAVIELKPGHSAEPDKLLAFCREKLGSVRAPKSIEIWDRLPRSPNGKVLKREVRAKFWVGRERQI